MFPVSGSNSPNEVYLLYELETTEEFYHTIKDSIITTGRFRDKIIVV
jgi:hypothetical protein